MAEKLTALQAAAGGFICPKHGLCYGSCACCRAEQEEQRKQDYVDRLRSENARLRAALEFYADEATWAAKETENPGTPSTWCPERGLVLGTSASTTISPMHVASEDRGERARAALGGSDG